MKIKLPQADAIGFQMAPLIDIVFLLNVFFMLVANVNQQARKPIDTPVASESTRPNDASGRGMITVTKDGKIFAGLQEVNTAQLTRMCEERIRQGGNFRIFLRADQNAKHKSVREVVAACAAGGVGDIIFGVTQAE